MTEKRLSGDKGHIWQGLEVEGPQGELGKNSMPTSGPIFHTDVLSFRCWGDAGGQVKKSA